MKKLNKKHITWITILVILILVIIMYIFNIANIKNKTIDRISEITIPFSLIVNPNNVDKNVTPKSIDTNVSDLNNEKFHVIKLVNNLDTTYQQTKKFSFLSNDQQKQLNDKVHDQSHQYIYKITSLNFGRDLNGKYLTISCNQYNDTKQIKSYRYRLHYKGNQITTSKYLGSTSAKYPPKYLLDGIVLGQDGIKKSKSFTQQIKTAIINSNLTTNSASNPGEFNQLAINLGLDPDESNKALFNLARYSNSRLTNFSIIGYELADVPRTSRIYIKQVDRKKTRYYTLNYDRNKAKYIYIQNGISSNSLSK
ncbi:hypothetical protein [Companilactobacillus mishanensis]|uniref:Regulatory protein YycH-like domain-containing protein n=1 Tax=Companilactobacillus mishanensis TaxID=2486008 RepID=A0ABW9P7C3_9LACO|nr:hypothetical protein [Companilactobacillus mishanensis]MQS45009.1 hypothetical protein [Companilactobacillus mishanensis]